MKNSQDPILCAFIYTLGALGRVSNRLVNDRRMRRDLAFYDRWLSDEAGHRFTRRGPLRELEIK